MAGFEEKVLLAVSGPKTEETFAEMIRLWKSCEIVTRATGREAWKAIQEDTYALVVILAPLRDSTGIDLAQMAAQTSSGVIFVCREQQYADACRKLDGSGVYVFSVAMGRRLFEQALTMMECVHVRLAREVPQTRMLQDKLRDIRVINRAKCLLIQYERMTEEQAHKTIERQAMNRRLSRREVAEEILESYGG